MQSSTLKSRAHETLSSVSSAQRVTRNQLWNSIASICIDAGPVIENVERRDQTIMALQFIVGEFSQYDPRWTALNFSPPLSGQSVSQLNLRASPALPTTVFSTYPPEVSDVEEYVQPSLDLFRKYYVESDVPFVYRLRHKLELWQDLSGIDNVALAIERLAGHVSIPPSFDGLPFLIQGPVAFKVWKNKFQGEANFGQAVLPFGNPTILEALKTIQAAIDGGSVTKFSLTVAGRVDLNFLNAVYGEAVGDPGPIPGIRFRYKIKAGDSWYSLSLAGDSELQIKNKRPLNPDQLARAQQLHAYLNVVENRLTPELLTSANFLGEPGVVKERVSNPASRQSYSAEMALIRDWHAWAERLLEPYSPKLQPAAPVADWELPARAGLPAFRQHLVDTLPVLASVGHLRAKGFFNLSNSDLETFLEIYSLDLHSICLKEMARWQREESDASDANRRMDGYAGPKHGYPLQTMMMLVDCIVDFRRRQTKSKRMNLSVEEVELDLSRTRSYMRALSFPTLEQLPQVIAEQGFKREVRVKLKDPLTERTTVNWEGKNPDELFRYLVETNFERIKLWWANSFSPSFGSNHDFLKDTVEDFSAYKPPGFGMIETSKVRTALLDARECWIKFLRAEGALNELKVELRTVSERAFNHFRGTHKNKALKDRIHAAAKPIKDKLARAEEKLLRAKNLNLKCIKRIFPDIVRSRFVSIDSIADQDVLRLAYNIDDKAVTRLCPEKSTTNDGTPRSSHSELSGGFSSYGAGMLVLATSQGKFRRLKDWRAFVRERDSSNEPKRCFAVLANNGSGHFGPDGDSLSYPKKLFPPALQKIGIDTDRMRFVDIFRPGMRPHGLSLIARSTKNLEQISQSDDSSAGGS